MTVRQGMKAREGDVNVLAEAKKVDFNFYEMREH